MTNVEKKKVLVLGATGMLGHAVLRYFDAQGFHAVVGSVRSASAVTRLPKNLQESIVPGVNVEDPDSLIGLFGQARPNVVVNCIGVVKQLAEADDPLTAIPINSMLPHRLARLCQVVHARLIHISTDCVFAGTRGMYLESDPSDAKDLYGRSKYLGEVDYPNAITLRTSIIGKELSGSHGLVEWFLKQQGPVKGFTKALFTGVPTVELARIIHDFVLPNDELHGVYHVSAACIDKYSLLREVARVYGKTIEINPDGQLTIDRSLDSTRFRTTTGYTPPDWPELVRRMHAFA